MLYTVLHRGHGGQGQHLGDWESDTSLTREVMNFTWDSSIMGTRCLGLHVSSPDWDAGPREC